MNIKLVVMLSGLSITSNLAPMLVKFSQKKVCKPSLLKARTVFGRHRYFKDAINNNDIELVDFLLKKEGTMRSSNIMQSNTIGMVNVFENYGIDVKELFTEDGNFLHYAVQNPSCGKTLIQYLANKGVDPKALTKKGDNLWHSLTDLDADEDTLLYRGNLLHELGVNPYHKNNNKKSAIDIVKEKIESNIIFRDEMNYDACCKEYNERSKRYHLLLDIMNDKKFAQDKINKE